MKPILFPSTATVFDTNGLGILGDAISVKVTREGNVSWELEMEYPLDGIHAGEIQTRSILVEPMEPGGAGQPFRVYDIQETMGESILIRGRHLAYDLEGYTVRPFTASSVGQALQKLTQMCPETCPFTFSTDKTTTGDFSVDVPTDIWSLLGGQEGSILDVYGGEWELDGWHLTLHSHRGQDRGVTIRYGKNLTDLTRERSVEETWTGVHPYWEKGSDEDRELVQVSGYVVPVPGASFSYTRILPLDLSREFDETPTSAQLRSAALQYMEDNDIGAVRLSIRASFVKLREAGEYETLEALEKVGLWDTVTIYHPGMDVYIQKRVRKAVYDGLLDQHDSLELGESFRSIVDILVR